MNAALFGVRRDGSGQPARSFKRPHTLYFAKNAGNTLGKLVSPALHGLALPFELDLRQNWSSSI
jgi:hypothetical protein